jgi:hypothetical protein
MSEELRQVVCDADEPPLGAHLVQAAEREAPDSARIFDVPDHGFNSGLAHSVHSVLPRHRAEPAPLSPVDRFLDRLCIPVAVID